LIRPHAEAAIAGFYQRLPQCRRTIAKRPAPARDARQVIDGRFVVTGEHTVEHIRAKAGGVTQEIDSCQAGAGSERLVSDVGNAFRDRGAGQVGAVIERQVPDAGDAVGDRDARQAGAVKERTPSDAGDAVGDRDAGQASAPRERLDLDAGDAVGDRVAPDFAPRVLDKRGLALVEQDPINTAIEGVERIHGYRSQASAVIERIHIPSDAGDATGECVAPGFARRTLDERGLALVEQDPIHTAKEGVERIHRYRGQAGAVTERIPSDAGDAAGDRDAGQARAVRERLVPDAGDAAGDRDAGQAGAVRERLVPDAGDVVRDCVAPGFAPRTLDERGVTLAEQDPIHTAIEGVKRIHRYRRQAGAVTERIPSDAGDALADRDAG